MTISACLVVRNEEVVIERCLESLQGVADEILCIHDGPCDDQTLDIAKRFGCKIFTRALVGNPEHHSVFAYEQARGEWILSIDADEFLSDPMKAAVREVVRRDDHAGWEFLWPIWDGSRYLTSRGPYKLVLFRRDATELVGVLQSREVVRGPVGRRLERLEHRPVYNNFTWRTIFTKWRRWAQIQADQYVHPFEAVAKFNYHGPDRWPLRRYISNWLSPLLAIPYGVATMVVGAATGDREPGTILLRLRLSLYQGVYATFVQLYVARFLYGGILRRARITRRHQ